MARRATCVVIALLMALAVRPSAQGLPAYTFSTFAGVPASGVNGTGPTAAFASPRGIAVDTSGNLYVADGSAIRRVTPSGVVSTFAGQMDQYGYADGPAHFARMSNVRGLAMGPDGTLYLTEATTIRTVSPTGVVATLAGRPDFLGGAPVDGVGQAARFTELRGGIAVAPDGVVFVADRYRVRMVTPAGVVTTLAGQSAFGAIDGTGSDAAFGAMTGMVVGADGDLLVAEEGVYISFPQGGGLCCGNAIRRVTRAGVVTTVAGVMGTEGGVDGAGATARLSGPDGMALAPDGTVRFLDHFGKIRALNGNVVTTLSPSLLTGGAPAWITVGPDGAHYVTDTAAKQVQRITADGSVIPIAGGATSPLVGPSAVARGADGTLYIADYYGHQIRALSPSGMFSVVPAVVNFPTGIAIDDTGMLYIADYGNQRVLRTRPEGPAGAFYSSTYGVRAVAARGAYVVVASGDAIVRLDAVSGAVVSTVGSQTAGGFVNGPAATARFRVPWGVAIDSAGQVFVADSSNTSIRRIDTGGNVTTLAGSAASSGYDDGVGSAARFMHPRALTVDAAGELYVSDTNNSTIRRVSPNGLVQTIGGAPQFAGASDGVAGAALFSAPWGITVDPSGVLWIADFQNGTIRRGEAGASATPLTVVSQPQSAQVSAGQSVSFTFDTRGVPDGSTRWQQSTTGPAGTWAFVGDSTSFSGSLTRVLTLKQPPLDMDGRWFRALAHNGVSSLVSDAVMLTVTGTPVVGTSPTNQSVVVGAQATFQVTAGGGSPAPTYQWERSTDGGVTFAACVDDAQHVGSTTNTLRVTPASTALQGARYRAVLTNVHGTATSSAATLTVLTLAITSHPAALTVRPGEPAVFTVVASGVDTLTYQWQQQWNDSRYPWVDLADGGAFSGVRTATLTINPASGSLDQYRYRAVVTMGAEQTISNLAVLSVPTTQLVATPSVLRFAAVKDGAAATTLRHVTAPQRLTVGYTGNTVPRWTMTSDQSWLQSSLTTAMSGAAAPELSIVNPGNVIGGATSLTATITITSDNLPWLTTTATVHLTVDQSGGPTTKPFGSLDTPIPGSGGHAGAMAVTGWALDDLGVTDVQIWRECLETIDRPRGACQAPVAGDSDAVYVGNALFVAGARPDVAALYPTLPLSARAGWGLLVLTNMLPYRPDGSPVGGQGAFTFHAYAIDVEGQRTRLGSTTVNIDNDGAVVPFGAIDTPAPGETLTNYFGRFTSQGWALARGGRCLAGASASTWRVYIDGVLLTGPQISSHGGQFRPDVRDAFPASCGSQTSGMFSVIEGAYLTNGQHTISWEAVDPDGHVGSFGSRFFTVLFPNASSDAPVAARDDVPAVAARQGWRNPVQATIGATEPVIIRPDQQLVHALELPAGRRLRLDLGGAVFAGAQMVAGATHALPGGSHLDAAAGVFSWEPPLGYHGRFHLVFNASNGPLRVDITIR